MWIITAWQCFTPEVIVKSFKKCCISSALDGSGSRTLWNGSEKDGDVRSECGEVEGTACEGGDSDNDWLR
jgi:hypothetical protein